LKTLMNHPSSHSSRAQGASIALWQQLTATAQALQAIRAGQSGTVALAAVTPALRPGVQALLFQVLRNLGRAQALRAQLAPRNPAPRVDALLCTALALAWDEASAPYAPFTLVNQAVEAAKRGAAVRQASFINACLRRFLREREDMVALCDEDPLARWNHPRWWVERLRQDYPQQWQAILQANNTHAPMALRVNEQKCSKVQYQQELIAIDLEAFDADGPGLLLQQAQPVQALPGWREGWVSVQDLAAQKAAPLLLEGMAPAGEGRALRVLDACAAPGGKTAHLLEHAGARGVALEVTALEVDAQRSARIYDTLDRLGLQAQVLTADAARPQDWWQTACGGQLFDAILLDAPCTASGIVRRHPDVRWLRRPSDVEQLAAIQAKLLDRLWPLLHAGGRMLYCTCSVFRAEGDAQVQAFLARNTQARLLPSPGHLLPGGSLNGTALQDNPGSDHDGFFYALFEKSPD
jgi:16S rRNA (cytosine967-C5)-methyltransferase